MEVGPMRFKSPPVTRTCPNCADSGWVVEVRDSVEEVRPCPDCRSRTRVGHLLQRAAIPPRYLGRGFDVYSVHHALQEKALRRAIEYVESFPSAPRGLLFVGPCGVGKTHLSVAILETLIQEKGVAGRFIDEAELLRRLQYSYGPDSTETEREVILPLMEVELLVWDDLGTGRPTEWVAETIRTIINHRYTYSKQTILSTNWPLQAETHLQASSLRPADQTLADRIGRRLFSRILEMCEIVEMEGPDARTEIHKARLDFQASQTGGPAVPPGKITCPQCASTDITPQDYSRPRRTRGESYVEAFCVCRVCASQFTARYFTRSGRVEYPTPP